jgi:aspartate-semialdehyde dehydrogenase
MIAVAIVGATGLVGSMTRSLLEERRFPIEALYLLASQQSVGEVYPFHHERLPVIELATFDFHRTHIVFFCAHQQLAAEYIPKAVACGNIVIDKSAYFRCQDHVPLIVPEVNIQHLDHYPHKHIIASPNCSTIPIAVTLKPIYDAVGIHRMNIATYQSVSGTGKEAVRILAEQTRQWLHQEPIHPTVYPQQIAFNVLPHIDDFQENGYTKEEMKMVWEMKKIFADQSLAVNPTAVRVPVFYGHAASVHLETIDKISAEQALNILRNAKGIQLIPDPFPPTPISHAAGKNDVYVGRVREDISHEHGLNLWIVSDNLRKGAALNAIQIAEHLIESSLC